MGLTPYQESRRREMAVREGAYKVLNGTNIALFEDMVKKLYTNDGFIHELIIALGREPAKLLLEKGKELIIKDLKKQKDKIRKTVNEPLEELDRKFKLWIRG